MNRRHEDEMALDGGAKRRLPLCWTPPPFHRHGKLRQSNEAMNAIDIAGRPNFVAWLGMLLLAEAYERANERADDHAESKPG